MLKLSTVSEPRFEVELPDGPVVSFDPWKFSAAVEVTEGTQGAVDAVNAFLTATRGEVNPPLAPVVLAPHHAMTLIAAVAEFTAGLDVSKKMRGLAPRT